MNPAAGERGGELWRFEWAKGDKAASEEVDIVDKVRCRS